MSVTATDLAPSPSATGAGRRDDEECILSRCSEWAACYALTSCATCGFTPPKGLPLCERHGRIAEEHIAVPCGQCPGTARVYALERL